ncbi:aminotransferase class I/II-fold pyridoxal phosphate-dependent enzyme [Leptospira ilyithenensis]|uniref:8-amino-7-oxononanoate synthase n=1 Tax=Leptospira ilyithenensis TaxID=2484901 RepID=A0A4R9LP33_9LEPT|nr:8-amino-7-oxononanoate synthase [Leptospira ilyithenensis]TGN07001.1 8-amino-7-oxononanoate synthase [Leptospira ilyithenensis]
MYDHWKQIEKEMESIRAKNLYRRCKVTYGIDFCSNDYLGLSGHPGLVSAFKEALDTDTVGSTAARLVRGHRQTMDDWENEFSSFVHSEASLTVANGFIANFGLIDTIADSRTVIFTDRLNHASILDGIRISGAIKKYYNHLNLDHLEEQLAKVTSSEDSKSKKKIIVSESLFSMDGDKPDLQRLVALKRKYNAVLILDEAHSFGIFGKDGRGLAFADLSEEEIESIDYRIYTLGKSLGLEGGIIATTKLGREHLVNRMRSFIFSTASLPAIYTAALKSLSLLRDMDKERVHLLRVADILRTKLSENGFSISPSVSHIVPILMESEQQALYYSEELRKKGLDVRAIRPPTVPTPRLRVSLNATIREGDIQNLVNSLIQVREGKKANLF